MTVLTKIKQYVSDKMKGSKHLIKMTRGEIVADVIAKKYHNAEGSIIPSDYCYNRFNFDLFRKNNIKVFVWDKDEDVYEFVGENVECSQYLKKDKTIYGKFDKVMCSPIGEYKCNRRQLNKEYLEYAKRKGKDIVKEYYE